MLDNSVQQIFFQASQSQTIQSLKHNFLGSQTTLQGVWLWGSTKFEKSPSAHVCDHKSGLKSRAAFSFIFMDRYDLQEARKYAS